MPPCEPVFQVIESGCDGENLEKLSMEITVLNVHYVIHILGFHVTLMRPDQQRSTLAVLLWFTTMCCNFTASNLNQNFKSKLMQLQNTTMNHITFIKQAPNLSFALGKYNRLIIAFQTQGLNTFLGFVASSICI